MIARNCNWCQGVYLAETRYINRGQGLFCGRACSGKNNGKARAVTHQPNTTCGLCLKGIWIKPSTLRKSKMNFCNRQCQNKAYATGVLTPGPARSENSRSGHSCPACGVNKTRLGECRDCKNKNILERWLAGDNSVTLNNGGDTKSFVKAYLRETRGDRCEVCGWDELSPDGRSIIQMDHIDGNCLNNVFGNLRLLCPNHHAMTSTYGSLNKGSGRAWRRKNG